MATEIDTSAQNISQDDEKTEEIPKCDTEPTKNVAELPVLEFSGNPLEEGEQVPSKDLETIGNKILKVPEAPKKTSKFVYKKDLIADVKKLTTKSIFSQIQL